MPANKRYFFNTTQKRVREEPKNSLDVEEQNNFVVSTFFKQFFFLPDSSFLLNCITQLVIESDYETHLTQTQDLAIHFLHKYSSSCRIISTSGFLRMWKFLPYSHILYKLSGDLYKI